MASNERVIKSRLGSVGGFLSLADRGYAWWLSFLNTIAVMLIFFIAIWVCIDVIARGAANHPIVGTEEVVRAMIPVIVFFTLAYTLRRGRHIHVELILDRLPWQAREIVILVSFMGGMILFALIAWYGWDQAWAGWIIREHDGEVLKVPVYPSRFALVLGAGLFSFQCCLNWLAVTRKLVIRLRGAE